MVCRLMLLLLGVALVILSMGSDSHAATKKKSKVQMDGAILVVSAVEGPVAAPPRGRLRTWVSSSTWKTIDGGRMAKRGANRSMYIAPKPRRGQRPR
jgi:hypothetical protein